MNKQQLLHVLSDYKAISTDDVKALKSLVNTYPYSQVLHTLIAKGSYENHTDTAQEDLHVAAMYTTDRIVLKNIITDKTVTRQTQPGLFKNDPVSKPTTIQKSKEEKQIGNLEAGIPLPESDAEALREDVLHNLMLLIESKKSYTEQETDEIKIAEVKEGKSKINKDEKSKEKETATNRAENTEDGRSELIDKFIEQGISMVEKNKTRSKATKEPQQDLSETSINFGDNIISENLAIILVKQGNTDKAIDIYKKLIWKFPQKKTYFATRIEELKK